MPTVLQAARISVPADAPALDGESLLEPSRRTTVYSEYWKDPANGKVSTWKSVRKGSVKYIHTYDGAGNIAFREFYDLTADPEEMVNLLANGTTSDDPPPEVLAALAADLDTMSACSGAACVR